jgi:hypothetical protein
MLFFLGPEFIWVLAGIRRLVVQIKANPKDNLKTGGPAGPQPHGAARKSLFLGGLASYGRSPECGDLWNKSRRLKFLI